MYFNLGAILALYGLISYNLATCKLLQRSEIFLLLSGLQNNVGLHDKDELAKRGLKGSLLTWSWHELKSCGIMHALFRIGMHDFTFIS